MNKTSIPGKRQAGFESLFKIFLCLFLGLLLYAVPSFCDQVADVGFTASQTGHETEWNKAEAKENAAETGKPGTVVSEKICQAENDIEHDVSLDDVLKRLVMQYNGLCVLSWMGLIMIIELGMLIILKI